MPPTAACGLALLLLLGTAVAAPAPWGKSTDSLGFGLDEEGCPYVDAEALDAFVWRGASDKGSPPLTKFQAANLACALKRMLARADAGNDNATETLFLLYRRWRSAFRPYVWHRQPVGKGTTQRFPTWLDNLRSVIATNELISLKHWAGLNAYSDMTSAEFAAHVLMAPTAPVRAAPGARKLLARGAGTTTTTINWLAAGKVLPTPGFAAQCGSSWAFAAADALASNLLISSRSGPQSLKAVSAQHIMDCTSHNFNYTSPSCAGGSVPDTFTLASQRGLAADTTWVYRPAFGGGDAEAAGFRARCDQAPTPKQVKGGMLQVSGSPAYTQVAPGKAALRQALAAQPAVALLALDPSFQHYAGGVWSPSVPCAELPASQHALLVVGFDVALGVEAFIVKNSWGAGWGERGFGRIAATADGVCGLAAAYQVGAVSRVAGSGQGKFYRSSLHSTGGGGKSG